MSYTSNPSPQEAEAGESGVQSHSQLQKEFGASLGYIRSCLKAQQLMEDLRHIVTILSKKRIYEREEGGHLKKKKTPLN